MNLPEISCEFQICEAKTFALHSLPEGDSGLSNTGRPSVSFARNASCGGRGTGVFLFAGAEAGTTVKHMKSIN